MPDQPTIVERLRKEVANQNDHLEGQRNAGWELDGDDTYFRDLLQEAADELERLAAIAVGAEAHSEQLQARVRELEERDEWQGEVLNELRVTMEQIGCCHGHDGKATPPMMYREWLLCCVKAAYDRALSGGGDE